MTFYHLDSTMDSVYHCKLEHFRLLCREAVKEVSIGWLLTLLCSRKIKCLKKILTTPSWLTSTLLTDFIFQRDIWFSFKIPFIKVTYRCSPATSLDKRNKSKSLKKHEYRSMPLFKSLLEAGLFILFSILKMPTIYSCKIPKKCNKHIFRYVH